MPIRINLLAEAQALEDLRRRDPVKRFIWAGAFLVAVMLAWSSSLQVKAMSDKRDVGRLEAQVATHTNEYSRFIENNKKLLDVNRKLVALRQLATNRFLNATLLNALQQHAYDDVQVVRLRADENYVANEETKAHTNEFQRLIPGKPASVTEKISVIIDAKDSGPNPGDLVSKYKEAIAAMPYFQAALGNSNDIRLANFAPTAPGPDGRPFRSFTLECRFPDRTR